MDYIENNDDIDNMYVMFLSSYAVEIENIYNDMTRIYNALNLRTATGVDLDIIGEKFNINRPAAKKVKQY